jgi:hypothetical protein
MSPDDDRIAALEQQVAALSTEVAWLRAEMLRADTVRAGAPQTASHSITGRGASLRHDALARASAAAAAFGEEEIESFVGRYGTLLLGALVMLMGVGVLIRLAVAHGLLTPIVRVGLGALVAAGVGAAGVYFHRRGEVRYANVLLALALALVGLVTWGAGPRFHLMSTSASLAIVDVVAFTLAALALHDGSEFLFCVAVAGLLSAPFVTTVSVVTADALLAYGSVVLVGSVRAVRHPQWRWAFAMLVGGALAYALVALGMPASGAGPSPFAVSAFSGACAAGALFLAEARWRGRLARAFLAVGLAGIPVAWDRVPMTAPAMTWGVALALAAITYGSLAIRERAALWTASALGLPLVSLGIVAAWAPSRQAQASVFAVWALFALAAWRAERWREGLARGGAHLLAGALLGTIAVGWAFWPRPMLFVTMLAVWGVLMALACREEVRSLPLIGVVVPLGIAALSAMDQLASRRAYSYAPFATRSSASALLAMAGLAAAGAVLSGGSGASTPLADRAVRIGALIGFVILWGRMEVVGAWSPDLAASLLIAYYAACGLGSILAGRRYAVSRLRLVGLGLAIYAAVKAIVEASEIGGVLLRVGAYGAVGVFLLAAGYLYREAGNRAAGSERHVLDI